MAASMLTKKQQNLSIRSVQKKRKSVKNVLLGPQKQDWPKLTKEDDNSVKETLKRVIRDLQLGVSRLKYQRGKDKDKNKQVALKERDGGLSPKQISARSQLVFGLNAVTRHLEKDRLELVIADGNSQPVTLANHLLDLADLRGCLCIRVSNLAEVIGPAFNLTTLVAMGFQKVKEGEEDHFAEVVKMVSQLQPQSQTENSTLESTESSDSEQSVQQCSSVGDVRDVEFQHLYIYKKDLPQDTESKFDATDFIAFSKNSSCDESDTDVKSTVISIPQKRRMKNKNKLKKKAKYQNTVVVTLEGNPDRKSGKKK